QNHKRERVSASSLEHLSFGRHSAFVIKGASPFHHPCPGLLTGGKLFRNSFCWRSASLCWSASRTCCAGLGPELAQPSNAITSVEIKIDLVSGFSLREIRTGR